MTETQQPPKRWQIPFFTIWSGQLFSLLGSTVAQFALVWWLTKLTDSATVLATATIVALIPQIFLGPIAGAYVDRLNRRIVMIVADGFIALMALWLAYLFWGGTVQVWHVYVLMFARAVGGSFHWPAMSASTSLMVPKQHLARVAGVNQALYGVMNVAGPPVGALLLAVLPMHSIMLVDVVTALIAISPLFFVHVPQPQRAAPVTAEAAGANGRRSSIWADVWEGLRYIGSWPGAMVLMAMAMVINFLLSPAGALTPLLVTRHFHGEALQLGWLQSGWGIGVVAGGLVLGVWGGFRRRIATSLMGVALMGVGFIMLGLAPATALWLAIAGNVVAGFMNPIANGPIQAVLQATVAPEMQGRVFTVVGSACALMMPLGLAVAGPLADRLGVQLWYVIGGVACLVMGTGAFFIPALANIEQHHGGAGEEGQPLPAPAAGAGETAG